MLSPYEKILSGKLRNNTKPNQLVKYNINVLKQVSFNKIYIYLISLIIFLIPSNLFFKINYSSAYVNGLLVDYLIPKFYVSDIPILLLFSLWLIEVIKNKQKIITKTSNLFFPSILISLIIIRQIFVSYPLASIWYLLRLIEVGFLGWFLTTFIKIKTIVKVITRRIINLQGMTQK